jgi:hypothetical protein
MSRHLRPVPVAGLVLILASLVAAQSPAPSGGTFAVRVDAGARVTMRDGCGGRFRLTALIEEASVVERILRHLHLPTEVPAPPLLGACSLGQDPDVAVFNSYA